MYKIKFNRPVPAKSFTNVFEDLMTGGLSDLIDSDFTRKSPSTNILESDNAFIIELAAPGLQKDSFNINVEKDQLIISSSVEEKSEESSPKFKKREFNYAGFQKAFHLNEQIDASKIEAKYDNGILTLILEKKEEAKDQEPRKISIR